MSSRSKFFGILRVMSFLAVKSTGITQNMTPVGVTLKQHNICSYRKASLDSLRLHLRERVPDVCSLFL